MPAAKKRPTTKKAPARAKAPRARSAANPGTRGPAPLVIQGFTWTPPKAPTARALKANPTTPWTAGEASWAPASPAHRLLSALSVGATWEDAARYARLHHITGRRWNTRGAEILGDHDSLDGLARTDPPLEHLALAAFHVLAAAARTSPIVGALETIERAAGAGRDWRAAVAQLKVLPTASDYRETTRTELTGEEGGPVKVTADATQQMLDLARQFAEHPPTPAAAPDDGEEPAS